MEKIIMLGTGNGGTLDLYNTCSCKGYAECRIIIFDLSTVRIPH